MLPETEAGRIPLVRRGLLLNYLTIAYNVAEAIISVVAGVVAGSVALIAFGFDSAIEVTSSGAANWRLRFDIDRHQRERLERITHIIIGWCFVVLACFVVVDSLTSLWQREIPRPSLVGVAILSLSVIVMPILARAKRRIAGALQSRALHAEATQTSLCAYLSIIALAGVGLNTAFGWWWADPVAALVMVPIIAMEGLEGLRSKPGCEC